MAEDILGHRRERRNTIQMVQQEGEGVGGRGRGGERSMMKCCLFCNQFSCFQDQAGSGLQVSNVAWEHQLQWCMGGLE